MRARNSDQDLRKLERAARAGGDPQAIRRYWQAAARLGQPRSGHDCPWCGHLGATVLYPSYDSASCRACGTSSTISGTPTDLLGWREGTRKRNPRRKKAEGDCFEAAVEFAISHGGLLRVGPEPTMPDLLIVHGEVTGQGKLLGRKYGHAWIEARGVVIDTSNKRQIMLPIADYYALGRIGTNVHKYTVEQARRRMVETGVYGPWDLQTSTGL